MCVPLPFFRFPWFVGLAYPGRTTKGQKREEGRTSIWTPASQCCRGLQVQRFTHSEPELSGVAVSDKLFIPYHAFSYGLRYVKLRFFLKLPCSPNSRP